MDKILKIQTEIGVLVKTETNPFFKSKYVDINGLLEQLLPSLEKHGITVIQPLGVLDGKNALITEVFDDTKLIIKSAILLPDLQDPQKMGSAITYYRRYALQSLFLLRAEDDDANNTKETPKVGKVKAYQAKNKADYENGVDPLKDNDLDL